MSSSYFDPCGVEAATCFRNDSSGWFGWSRDSGVTRAWRHARRSARIRDSFAVNTSKNWSFYFQKIVNNFKCILMF